MNRLKAGRPFSVEVVGPRFRYYCFVICGFVFWIGLHNLLSVGKVVPPLACLQVHVIEHWLRLHLHLWLDTDLLRHWRSPLYWVSILFIISLSLSLSLYYSENVFDGVLFSFCQFQTSVIKVRSMTNRKEFQNSESRSGIYTPKPFRSTWFGQKQRWESPNVQPWKQSKKSAKP